MNTREKAYEAGHTDSLALASTTPAVRARLARDPDYWDGWHDARPAAASIRAGIVEDPTRPGGWCCT